MGDLLKEYEIETEARKRTQKHYRREKEEWFDTYYDKLLKEGNPYVKRLSKMSLDELEEEYIAKSVEVAKLPPAPVEKRERVAKGAVTVIQRLHIRKGSYLETQLWLVGAAIRRSKKQRVLWTKQKQEWVFEMKKLYDKNPNRYKSLADTIKQEFPKYDFSRLKNGWTLSRALNLAYKTPPFT